VGGVFFFGCLWFLGGGVGGGGGGGGLWAVNLWLQADRLCPRCDQCLPAPGDRGLAMIRVKSGQHTASWGWLRGHTHVQLCEHWTPIEEAHSRQRVIVQVERSRVSAFVHVLTLCDAHTSRCCHNCECERCFRHVDVGGRWVRWEQTSTERCLCMDGGGGVVELLNSQVL